MLDVKDFLSILLHLLPELRPHGLDVTSVRDTSLVTNEELKVLTFNSQARWMVIKVLVKIAFIIYYGLVANLFIS